MSDLKAPQTGNTVLDRFFKELVTWARDKTARLAALDMAEVKVVTASDHVMTSEDHVEYNGSGGHKITLPLANSLGGRRARPRYITNNGTGTVTLVANAGPDGANTVEAGGTAELAAGHSAVVNPNGATRWRAIGAVALGVLRTLYNGTNSAPGGVQIIGASTPTSRNLLQIETELGRIVEVRTGSTVFGSNIHLRGAVTVNSGSVTVSDSSQAGVVKIGNSGSHIRCTGAGAGITICDTAAEKWAMHGGTPTDQLAAIPDATDLATALTSLNTLLAGMREKEIIDT